MNIGQIFKNKFIQIRTHIATINNFPTHEKLMIFVISVLGILSTITIIYGFIKTAQPIGGIDIHAYWYSGTFFRQGLNPYAVYLTNETPTAPIYFIDGNPILNGNIANKGLSYIPTNTAPLVLILTALSFFSWSTAKYIWLINNIALMLMIPWLALKLFPNTKQWLISEKCLLAFIFYTIYGTRNTLSSGQLSLLIIALMVASLLTYDKYKILSGILFGIALSKYSLALPLLLLFIYMKELKIITIALITQLFGLMFASIISKTSPVEIFMQYIGIMKVHSATEGIHLGNLFPGQQTFSLISVSIMTLVVFVLLGGWYIHKKPFLPTFCQKYQTIVNLHLLSIFSYWSLLLAYHRAYDTVISIFFFVLLFNGIHSINTWSFMNWKYQKGVMLTIIVISYAIHWLPASSFGLLLDNTFHLRLWLLFQGKLITINLLFLLFYTIYLLFHLAPTPSNSVKIMPST